MGKTPTNSFRRSLSPQTFGRKTTRPYTFFLKRILFFHYFCNILFEKHVQYHQQVVLEKVRTKIMVFRRITWKSVVLRSLDWSFSQLLLGTLKRGFGTRITSTLCRLLIRSFNPVLCRRQLSLAFFFLSAVSF
jgi:hypothetical protein